MDGSTNLNGITDWKVGDWAIYNGSVWQKVDNSESVTSVFGRVGSITAVAGDYSATQITNTASGSITATNVQDAINELDGEKLAKASNLSDVASVTTSRTNLGVTATGADTTYAYRANNLNDLASVTSARTNLGLGSAALESATFFLQSANSLNDVASVALARTNLGLGSIATQSAGNVTITGGTITGITDLAIADGGTGASNADDARTNLGLGSAAVQSATYFLQVANNLSDVVSVALARTNLGLGNSATRDVGTTAGTVAAGDDARFTDSRTPTGPAGGDLTGTYPNPSLTISGVTAGGYGSASSAVVITIDSKGRAKEASAVNILIAESQVTNLVTDLASKIPSTEKGANSGVATLDSGGKIPLTQLPDSILGQVTYMGTWNAATNSPTLANPPATTTLGDYYIVTTGGTFASITFNVGDWIISNGADGWAKVDNTDAVASVFGRTGTVTATNGDYTASNITNVPAGNIVATEVQAAINELDGDKLAKASNLSDLVSPSTARTNLGLGSAATQSTTYFLQTANNLSDLASVTTARSNLGLGSIATQNASNVSITGGSITGITDLAVADGGTGVSTTPANGQLLIGNGTGYSVANLTAGTGVTITNSSGGISIATTGAQSAETLTATVTNAESTTITKGQVVYAFGATGNRMSVKLAYNTSDATSAKTLGIVSDASIAANGTGTITLVGTVDGLTLGAYTEGDQLYLGATAGSLTSTKPYAPNHLVYVGIVERANNGNGELYVRVQNGYELNEIHDVQITTPPSAGALLVYDATNALWKAARLTAGTNIAVTNADASVTVGITGVIAGTNGGTGVNNGANTITIAGNVTHAGAFTQSFTATANTSLTLPVTGTLATLAGSEALSNKTITASAFNGTVGATTASTGAFTTLSASGNVTITGGTNQRIFIDTVGTAPDRFAFQESTANSSMVAMFIPSGTSTTSTIGVIDDSNYTNGIRTRLVAQAGKSTIIADAIGTGTASPLYVSAQGVNDIGVFSSTGLAVTGALSSTTGANFATSSGVVNIGTTTSVTDTRLTVQATGDYSPAISVRGNASAGNWARMDLVNPNTAGPMIFAQVASGETIFRNEGTTSSILLQTAGGVTRATVSTTGLAVTGAITATGQYQFNGNRFLDSSSTELRIGDILNNYTTVGLYSQGAAAMILKAGNVGIGTTSPAQRLHVQSGSATVSPITTTSVTGDTTYQAILVTKFDNDSTTSQNFIQFQINNGGANCGKITANGANTAAFGSTSDKRVKENIADLPSQLANIMALRPVEFDYVESYGGGHQIGFVAQEMQEVYPDVIAEDASEEKILSITGWSKTEARLVKALQELNSNLVAQVAALSQRLAALESN